MKSIQREGAIINEYIKNKDETFKYFYKKLDELELFSEEEMQIVETLSKAVSDEEVQYISSILPKTKEVMCHNDLNNLNIFYMPQ